MSTILSEDRLVVWSITLIVLAGSTILLMDYETNARRKRLCLALTQGFWKFKPIQLDEVKVRQMNWMRMQLAGVMIAGTSISMCVKALKVKLALIVAVVLFLLWSVMVSLVFWMWIPPKVNESNNSRRDDLSSAVPGSSLGWANRLKRNRNINGIDETAVDPQSSIDDKHDGDNYDNRLPITCITGFLGSGKTTLVKRILDNTAGIRVLVIENEIGAEGIDHELLLQHTKKEEIILMNNGCVCCTVRKDLISTFHKLFADPAIAELDWVVLETTGLSDPAPLIQSLYMDPECNAYLRLDSVLTIVDAKHMPLHLSTVINEGGDDAAAAAATTKGSGLATSSSSAGRVVGAHGGKPEAVQQLVFADRIIINKTDLLRGNANQEGEQQLDALVMAVRRVNPSAEILCCEYANVPIEQVLNIRAFDPSRNADLLKKDLQYYDSVSGNNGGFIRFDQHGKIVTSKRVRPSREMNQAGGDSAESSSSSSAVRIAVSSSSSSVPSTDVINTVSLVTYRPLDLDTFNLWVAALLRTEGARIYRLKGILAMHGYDRQFVAHGVHMIFDGELGPMWPQQSLAPSIDMTDKQAIASSNQRRSRLVLIGLNLDLKKLQAGFAACEFQSDDDLLQL